MRVKLFSKLLNISEHELPRVIASWVIMLFLRVGFVVGWTVVIAMFVNRMGIANLPFLFITHAILVIIGTLIFSNIIEKVRKEILILINILLAAVFLISASIFVLYSNWLFFGLVLLAESVMLAQLNILIAAFVEEMFSPLESQRTFPIVESSETIGLIIGGVIVSSLAHTIPSYKFLYLWVLFIMLLIPIILSFKNLSTEIPVFESRKEKKSSIKRISENLKSAKKNPFLKGLIIIIIFQWMFINLLEFQYTKSVQQNVYHEQEETVVFEEYESSNIQVSLIDSKETTDKIMSEAFAEPKERAIALDPEALEGDLTAKLGLLQIFFGVASLLMQILISSRILKGIGIIKSMEINPLIAMAGIASMIFRFNIFTASITRGATEMTGVLFQNAYHSSYYAFNEKVRDQMKELLEGIIKPIGAILGMSIIILLENFLFGPQLTFAINLILFTIALFSTLLISHLQNRYTEQSEKNLEKGNTDHTRLNAIEILGQKGHKIDYAKLVKLVQRKSENEDVKLKIIGTLRETKDPKVIPHLITCLHTDNTELRLAVIEALGDFNNLSKQFYKSAFGQFRIQDTLKKLFTEEENEEVRYAIIKVLAHLNPEDIVPFLLKKLKSKDEKIVADCIYICGLFHDYNSITYLEKFLDHKDPKIRANAIIALWQFKKLKTQLTHYLDQLINSKKDSYKSAGIYVIAELQLKEKRRDLLKLLKEDDKEVIFALGMLSENSAIPHLLDYILKNKKNWKEIEKKIRKFPTKFLNTLMQYLHHEVSHMIHKILKANSHLKPEKFTVATLEELSRLYDIIGETKAKEQIEKLL